MSIQNTVSLLKELSDKFSKRLWVDIKGRQLRIIKWADPLYECIELNHDIEILYPAKIYFRNGESSNITHNKRNKVFCKSIAKQALGAGQSVNIIAKELNINGYLTQEDKEYLKECNKSGLKNIMASYVENVNDIKEILKIIPNANIVSKIESANGLRYISSSTVSNLMAARDDLFIETGQNYDLLKHLNLLLKRFKWQLCASRIFASLKKG